MPLDDLHRELAIIVLGAAAERGFALGGGNALIQHGVISRPTQDVDLFTDSEGGVSAAADGTLGATLVPSPRRPDGLLLKLSRAGAAAVRGCPR